MKLQSHRFSMFRFGFEFRQQFLTSILNTKLARTASFHRVGHRPDTYLEHQELGQRLEQFWRVLHLAKKDYNYFLIGECTSNYE